MAGLKRRIGKEQVERHKSSPRGHQADEPSTADKADRE